MDKKEFSNKVLSEARDAGESPLEIVEKIEEARLNAYVELVEKTGCDLSKAKKIISACESRLVGALEACVVFPKKRD